MQIQILITADINESEKEKFNDEIVECLLAGAIGGCGSSLLMTGLMAKIRVPHPLAEKFPPMFNHILKGVDNDLSNAMLI
jgi:hypothetical protein